MDKIYVLADDGLFYENPLIEGGDWYIQFDPEGCPELSVVSRREETLAEKKQQAEQCLVKFGIGAAIIGSSGVGNRWIGGSYWKTNDWNLKFHSPLPKKIIKKSCKGVKTPPKNAIVDSCGKENIKPKLRIFKETSIFGDNDDCERNSVELRLAEDTLPENTLFRTRIRSIED